MLSADVQESLSEMKLKVNKTYSRKTGVEMSSSPLMLFAASSISHIFSIQGLL